VSLAKGEIQLQPEGGTFVAPVVINDKITLNFTLDSGAADVSIPADVASTLVRTGTVTQEDYLGNKTFVLADGSTVPGAEFRIRSLKVGNIELQDVTASIGDAKGPLLLGQSFLGRLASWSIDNQRHVLRVNMPNLPASPAEGVNAAQDLAAAASGAPVDAAAASIAAQGVASGSGAPEQAAMSRALGIMDAWSSSQDPTGVGVRRFYADVVNYYGAPTDVGTVMLDKTRFASRWPVRSYQVRPSSLAARCSSPNDCAVAGILDWRDSNPATGANSVGVAQFSYEFRDGLIVSESGKVLSRQ
jgi:clan AA aspartic protease (TIGR02281 family)